MASKVPQKKDFEKAKKCAGRNKYLKFFIIFLSLTTIVLSYFNIKVEWFNNINCFFLFILMSLHFLNKWRYVKLYRRAEMTRRKGFLDKAFGTKLSNMESEGYYDTDDVPIGYRRFLANLHENCFYSNRISEKMCGKSRKKLIVLLILFSYIVLINLLEIQIIVAFINAIMVTDIIWEYLSLENFYKETAAVLEECENIWQNYKEKYHNPDNGTMAVIIKAYVHYETILAYESVMLDSKIYKEMNAELEIEWENLKKRYCING